MLGSNFNNRTILLGGGDQPLHRPKYPLKSSHPKRGGNSDAALTIPLSSILRENLEFRPTNETRDHFTCIVWFVASVSHDGARGLVSKIG